MKVGAALEIFQQNHNTDPRAFLNTYFWSVIVTHPNKRLIEKYSLPQEITRWLNEQYEQLDFVYIGSKIWFTSQDQYTHFRLTWEEYLDKSEA